ncbi:MAG: ArsR/SmtB family transcription factor [Sandaracinaceae bacterium]
MSKAAERSAASLFFALGDGTRLSVVRKLAAGGALSATALSADAQVSRQAIAKHLRVLEDVGLVTHDKKGREVLYALETRRLEDARSYLDSVSASWDRAIDRLRALVEEDEPDAGAKAKRRKR